MSEVYDVVIIGAGPGGLTSAIYASRANLNVLMIERGIPGGQMANTEEIENYPSYLTVRGPELAQSMLEHAKSCGAIYKYGDVKNVTKEDSGMFKVDLGKTNVYGKTIIIGTGSRHLKLGVKGEEEFAGRGVSYCAVCDGAFFKERELVVVGGGDSAVEEALYLTNYASKVRILVRSDKFKAQPVLVERAKKNPKIEIIFNKVVEEIVGEGEGFSSKVSHVQIKDTLTNEISELKTDGVFIYIGLKPNSEIFNNFRICNENGYILTNDKMETRIPGLFAIGDVRETPLRQVISACGDGSIAGQEAYKYIENNN